MSRSIPGLVAIFASFIACTLLLLAFMFPNWSISVRKELENGIVIEEMKVSIGVWGLCVNTPIANELTLLEQDGCSFYYWPTNSHKAVCRGSNNEGLCSSTGKTQLAFTILAVLSSIFCFFFALFGVCVKKDSRLVIKAGVCAVLSALSSIVSFSLWTTEVAKPLFESVDFANDFAPTLSLDASYSFSFVFVIISWLLMFVVMGALKLHVDKTVEVETMTSDDPDYTNGDVTAFEPMKPEEPPLNMV